MTLVSSLMQILVVLRCLFLSLSPPENSHAPSCIRYHRTRRRTFSLAGSRVYPNGTPLLHFPPVLYHRRYTSHSLPRLRYHKTTRYTTLMHLHESTVTGLPTPRRSQAQPWIISFHWTSRATPVLQDATPGNDAPRYGMPQVSKLFMSLYLHT